MILDNTHRGVFLLFTSGMNCKNCAVYIKIVTVERKKLM